MRLQSVHLQNYRGHRDLTVNLDPSFNALVGSNGSGKTSVLHAISAALSGLTQGLPHSYSPLREESEVSLSILEIEGRLRFERLWPSRIAAVAELQDKRVLRWHIERAQSARAKAVYGGDTPSSVLHLQHRSAEELASLSLPLVAFYRASRNWNQPQPNEIQAAVQRNSRLDAWTSWWDASVDGAALQAWVIGKCLERYQSASELNILSDDVAGDELALVNAALARAIDGAVGLRFDLKYKGLLVEWRERPPDLFENLSDGQRAIVGLVTDIARRQCLLNPHLGEQATTETPGVVLIDELDMHLHPQWQRAITHSLKNAFPRLQFVVATHSPQVLSELKPEEIILLAPRSSDIAHPQVSHGLDSSRVLEEVMGADSRPEPVQRLLDRLFSLLESGESLELARQAIEAIEEVYPGLAELSRARALLVRKSRPRS